MARLPTPVTTWTTVDSRKIGDLLKAAREARGLSIPNAVSQTKIKRTYLEAMESGNFSVLENMVYIRNFVRTYARFLKIPESTILPLLEDEKKSDEVKPAAPKTPDTSDSAVGARPAAAFAGQKRSASHLLIVSAVALILGGFYLVFQSNFSGTDVQPSDPGPMSDQPVMSAAPPIVQDTGSAQSDSMAPDPTPADAVLAQPVSLGHVARMRATSEVWRYWESESTRSNKLLQAGENMSIPFEKNLHLRVGNPSGLTLSVDGSEVVMDTGKVYDRIFRVEDGRVIVEPSGYNSFRRLRSRTFDAEDP